MKTICGEVCEGREASLSRAVESCILQYSVSSHPIHPRQLQPRAYGDMENAVRRGFLVPKRQYYSTTLLHYYTIDISTFPALSSTTRRANKILFRKEEGEGMGMGMLVPCNCCCCTEYYIDSFDDRSILCYPRNSSSTPPPPPPPPSIGCFSAPS